MDLVNELEFAGHTVSQVKLKRALLRRNSKDYGVVAETVTGSASNYNDAVSKIIVREAQLNGLDKKAEHASVTNENTMVRKCFQFRKVGHIA